MAWHGRAAYAYIKENCLEREERIQWQETLKAYFNEEIQYISVKTLLYDIFTTNLSIEEKAELLGVFFCFIIDD